jgi:hypothetical protein
MPGGLLDHLAQGKKRLFVERAPDELETEGEALRIEAARD